MCMELTQRVEGRVRCCAESCECEFLDEAMQEGKVTLLEGCMLAKRPSVATSKGTQATDSTASTHVPQSQSQPQHKLCYNHNHNNPLPPLFLFLLQPCTAAALPVGKCVACAP